MTTMLGCTKVDAALGRATLQHSDSLKGFPPMRVALTAALLLLSAATLAHAGASSTNFPTPAPDPDTQSMRRSQAKVYVAQGCEKQWAKSSGLSPAALSSACRCYSGKTVNEMTKAEFDFFRAKSYFDDATREKALKAIDGCNLKRPI